MLAIALFSLAVGQVRVVADAPPSAATAEHGVDVFVINEGDAPADATPPAELGVTTADGVRLRLLPVDAAVVRVAAGGFRTLRYRPVAAPVAVAETQVATAAGTTAGVFDRFEPHAPIYGVFGAGSDGAKLQVSLAFRPFDGAGALDGVRLAWTQTMFWAIERSSGPFRSTNYNPEIYYERALGGRVVAAAGYAHDSNGRDSNRGGDVGSIDVNRLYLGGTYALPLGDGWTVEATPRVWTYVGTGYRDLDRYWGNMALGAAVGQVDGLRIAASLRNPLGRHRAGEVYASYPIHLIRGGTGLYLFGQAFAGHGEAIDDYRVRTTTARLGVALTR